MDNGGNDHHEDACCEECRDGRLRLLAELKNVGKLPDSIRPRIENSLTNLWTQRSHYAAQVAKGETLLQVSVDFIDNVIAQVIPTYVPPNGRTCKCHHEDQTV